ncbi:MAG: TonB-dependent receptor [Gammaproteobacteria bacterium]|nr:TonB-dependent receptor [Gammaproteobacteria bacterium]
MRKARGIWFLGAAAAAPAAALAAAAQAPSSVIEEVRIVGQRAEARHLTGSAFAINAEELKKFSQTDINRVLRAVPGVYMREEEGYGLRPNIGIRGSGAERSSKISLMEDGVLIAPAPYADPAAYYFPTAGRMSAIEVLKGPETMRYGPFTVGGAMNMVSTPIPRQAGGRVLAEVGGNGEQRVMGNYGAGAEQYGWLLETVQHQADGFHDIDRSGKDTGFEIEDYVAKARLNSAEGARFHQQLDVKLQYSEETSNASYLGLSDEDFDRDENRRYGLSALDEMTNEHQGYSARYRFEFSEQLGLNLLWYRNEFTRDWFKLDRVSAQSMSGIISAINTGAATAPLYQGWLDGTLDVNNVEIKHNNRDYEAEGLQFTLDARFATGAWEHELEFGARRHEDEIDRYQPVERYNQVAGQLVYASTLAPTSASNNAVGTGDADSFWLLDRITHGALTLVPLIRVEDIETRNRQWSNDPARAGAPSVKGNRLGNETSLGLGATWDIDGHWQLLAGVHEGFAPPGADSVDGTEAEESLNYEGGVRYTDERYSADAIFFYSDYTNTIKNCSVANPCTSGQTVGTESLGESEIQGVEIGLNSGFDGPAGTTWPLRFSYTWTDAEVTEDSETRNVLEGDTLADIPEQVAALSLGVVHPSGWDSYLNASYYDQTCSTYTCDRAGVDDRFLRTDDLFLVDWTAGYRLFEGLRVYAKLNNLFDEQVIVSRKPDGARANMPRTAYLGADWSF